VQRNAKSVLPNYTIKNSQVPMGDSVIDFEVTANGIGSRHGLEIKGFTKETWNEALGLAKKRLGPPAVTLTAEEAKIVGKLDRMVKQLKDAQAHTGNAPMLGLTSKVPPESRKVLQQMLEAEGLGNTIIIEIPETAIADISRNLRTALGLP
jgi:hypothetical protein